MDLSHSSKSIAKGKFQEIQRLFKRLSDEMCKVVESYYIWETLVFLRSIPEIGKEKAEKNAATMNLYNDFFITTEYNHMQAFTIGIAKFFDRDSRALSIRRLIQEIKESQDIITADLLMEIYPDRFYAEDFKDGYKPLHEEDLKLIIEFENRNELITSTLKTIRDKQFSHTDIEVIQKSFIPKEVVGLIGEIQEMLNKLSSRFDRSETSWEMLKDESIRKTCFLLENLERGEAQRKEEVWKKHENQ